eukprot:INCI9870.2.p1 GENE.INCI9870.2~~INCI9870.2.p1  ORF type:complete len:286 (+),score=48.22 INCI9870.2:534-1391(+)
MLGVEPAFCKTIGGTCRMFAHSWPSPSTRCCASSRGRTGPRIFKAAHEDENVRAIVLGGSGKHFTSGLDLTDSGVKLMELIEAPGPDVARRAFKLEGLIRRYQESFTAIEKCSVPVIAAIQGACVGAGLDVVSACDIRYCSEDAFFSIKEVDVGLAADVGTLQRMPKVMGSHSLLRELAYTARNMLAAEALTCGFVSKVRKDKESTVEAAVRTAALIAEKSPVAVEGTKRNLNFSRDHSVDEGLNYIATWNAAMLQTEDIRKGVTSFATKKQPSFAAVDNKSSDI